MFSILTVICMQYSEWICCKFNSIFKVDRNHADKTSLLNRPFAFPVYFRFSFLFAFCFFIYVFYFFICVFCFFICVFFFLFLFSIFLFAFSIHTRNTSKTQRFALIETKKKKTRKKSQTESLHLTVEMTRLCPRNFRTNKVTAETTKQL